MKKIKFTCPGCDAKLRVPTHLAGVSAPCPKCGATITAPSDLDHVVEETPREASNPGNATPSTNADAVPQRNRAVSGSVLAAPGKAGTAAKNVATENPGARTHGSPAGEGAPVLPNPGLAAPAAPPVDAPPHPASPSPVPALPEKQRHESDAESEVIVTEEKIISPHPVPLTPPEVSEIPPDLPEESPGKNAGRPLPKTQPIRVNPHPDSLLPPRGGETAGQELPRLDVNLAEPASEDASAASPGIPEPVPKRVQLPQVGSVGEELSPEDFFSSEPSALPPSPPVEESPPEVPPVAPVNADVPPPLEAPAPGSFASVQAPGETGHGDADLEPPVREDWSRQYRPADPPEEGTHMDQIESTEATSGAAPENSPPEECAPAPVSEGSPEEFPFDDQLLADELPGEELPPPGEGAPEARHSLEQGSFENLLSQRVEPEDPAKLPGLSSPDQGQVVSPDFPFPSSEVENTPIPPTRPEQTPTPTRNDADVLDEMFGSSRGPRKMKKSTMVIISVIVAVIIIASIFVYMIGKALGGFNPTIAERAQGQVPPPPFSSIEDESDDPAPANPAAPPGEPGIDDAPAIIDPVARERVPANQSGTPPIAPPADAGPSTTEPSAAPGRITPPAPAGPGHDDSPTGNSDAAASEQPLIAGEEPNLTFEERLENTLNRTGNGESVPSVETNSTEAPGTGAGADTPAPITAAGAAPANGNEASPGARNYNPPAAFAAPDGSETSPLGKTHDLLDAFLRAPDWQAQIPYIYQGESLRPVIEDYYKKFPFASFERFSLTLFQLEDDPEMGGPYWVYLVSTSDTEQGYPVIVRVENGNLKVDWEIYSEFQDRHFARFLEGSIASPGTFRVVIERVSDYYGPDRSDFTELGDYLVYQINPPYGDLGEFSEYAFVKKESEVAKQLEEVVGLGEEALAVIVTLEQKKFAHGIAHEVVTDYVTEGWFR